MRGAAWLGIVLAAALVSPADAAPCSRDWPRPESFHGRWRVQRMVGADLGGVEADHRAMLGKIVQWSADEVRTPTRTCSAAAARVVTLANRDLAQDWGGETISDLQLPRSLKARAFGKRSTRVLKGAACADDAVLATGDQLILMLDNGYIYLLRRMPGPARPSH